jgi:hypothetical protein
MRLRLSRFAFAVEHQLSLVTDCNGLHEKLLSLIEPTSVFPFGDRTSFKESCTAFFSTGYVRSSGRSGSFPRCFKLRDGNLLRQQDLAAYRD